MIIALLMAAAAATDPAAAAPATPVSPVTVESTVKDPNKVTCKAAPPTGTRLSARVCRTNAEWNQIRERAKQQLMEDQSRGQLQRERG